MATMQGITGKLSGKMGSAVFRVREGQQVVTQYNPIVKNPNTIAQQSNRATFKLMSQLSAVMGPYLRGFGSFIIKTRGEEKKGKTPQNRFVQMNYPLVTTTDESTGVVAKIPMEKIQLTSSFRLLPQMNLTQGNGRAIHFSMENIPAEVSMLCLVVINYRGNGISQACIENILEIPVTKGTTGIGNVDENISVINDGNYTVLSIGLIPSTAAVGKLDLDNIHTPADEEFISEIKLTKMVRNGDMAATMTVGENITLSI